MNPTLNHINLWMAWIGILLGLLSGALIGLFFHSCWDCSAVR
nr:YtxH domain-containing protein [Accumulibacter sp.]